ncbi:MAG: hypothetical protein R2709_14395 [Marmoricola sp.]
MSDSDLAVESGKRPRRWLRRTLLGLALVIVVALVGFFTLAPGIVERGRNQGGFGGCPRLVSRPKRRMILWRSSTPTPTP